MRMNIIQFISRRYLFSKKHISLISILTGISIGGITIGTALLIVILSVFNGFFDVIRGYLLSFDPDIRVEMTQQSSMFKDQATINFIHRVYKTIEIIPSRRSIHCRQDDYLVYDPLHLQISIALPN